MKVLAIMALIIGLAFFTWIGTMVLGLILPSKDEKGNKTVTKGHWILGFIVGILILLFIHQCEG